MQVLVHQTKVDGNDTFRICIKYCDLIVPRLILVPEAYKKLEDAWRQKPLTFIYNRVEQVRSFVPTVAESWETEPLYSFKPPAALIVFFQESLVVLFIVINLPLSPRKGGGGISSSAPMFMNTQDRSMVNATFQGLQH